MYSILINNHLIDDNLGLSVSNQVNYKYEIANDGSAILNNYNGDIAREFSFSIYSEMGNEYNDKKNLINNLLVLNKKQMLDFVALDLMDNTKNIRCKINILSVEEDFEVEHDSVNIKFNLIEVKPANNTVVKFNTFNYKPATVKTSKTATKAKVPTAYKKLAKCNISFNCNIKNNTCVKYLQTLLKSDGFYKAYKTDGQPCTFTLKEFKKWQQKKAKVKVTSKFDTATKNYLKKRFGVK